MISESACQNNFVNLILNHFSYFYWAFFKLKDNQGIEIISYSNYEQGYWNEDEPEKYNKTIIFPGENFEIINSPGSFIKKIFEKELDKMMLIHNKLFIQDFRNSEKILMV